MQVDLSILISVISVSFALFTGITNIKRNNKQDTVKSTSELATVIIELKYISNGIADIKHEMNNIKDDIQGLRDKSTTHSEAIKNLLSRTAEIEKKIEKYHERIID